MKENLSFFDKGVRVTIALIVVTLFLTNVISGLLAYILLALSAVFVFTSMVSFCPIYSIFKISSKKQTD